MFSKSLDDYIVVVENVISKELRESIVTDLKNSSFVTHKYNDATNNIKYNNLNNPEFEIKFDYTNKEYEDLVYKCVDVYSNNISSLEGAYLSKISKPRYNKYNKNNNMEMHVDHIHSLFDGERKGIPALSI